MSQRTYLDRAAIFAVPDLQTEEVEVPEWGTWVRVRGLTAAQRDDWEASCLTGKGKNTEVNVHNLRTKLVVRSVVDTADRLMFKPSDAEQLGEKSGSAIDRIYEVAARLSGISDRDVDELTKNSETSQSDGSGSA